jgi:hypothetical protein
VPTPRMQTGLQSGFRTLLAVCSLAFALQADADVIVGTNFTGRTISGKTATITDYTLNGVASPGNWTVVDATGNLFTTADATGRFAVADNPPTWNVTLPLTVGASAINLTDVTINFESFTVAGVSKVPTNFAPAHNVTVEIRDSLNVLLATQNIAQPEGPTADYWVGTYTNFSGVTLAAGQTYSLKITTGGSVGNNLGIDSFAINGTFAIAAADIQLTITPNGANYDFSWNSQNGKLYRLVTSTDLATPIAEWPVYNDGVNPGYDGILPSGTGTNTLTAVVPIGPKRFFAVVESNAP